MTAAELCAEALTIACPSCSAPPGKPCQDRPATHSHIKRRLASEGAIITTVTPALTVQADGPDTQDGASRG